MDELTVGDLVVAGALVKIDEHASLLDAIRALQSHNITSCPVTDHSGHILGWVSWSSILSFLVDFVWESKEDARNVFPRTAALTKADLQRLNGVASSASIHGVLQAASATKLKSVRLDSPLYDAMKLLSKGRQHLAPVVDKDKKLVGVISQRDLLKFFALDPTRLGPVRVNTVRGLAMATGHVSCVRHTDLALDAFFSITQQGFGGAGIIDADGHLVGNLSTCDLALMDLDFLRLQNPVADFVRWQSPKTVNDTNTLEQVVNTLYTEKIRRLYLVNSQGAPVGIVTLTDVIRSIWSTLAKPVAKVEAPEKTNKFKAHLEKEANQKGAKHSAKTGEKSANKKKDKKKKAEEKGKK
jgi:CBS domain-containing protein